MPEEFNFSNRVKTYSNHHKLNFPGLKLNRQKDDQLVNNNATVIADKMTNVGAAPKYFQLNRASFVASTASVVSASSPVGANVIDGDVSGEGIVGESGETGESGVGTFCEGLEFPFFAE